LNLRLIGIIFRSPVHRHDGRVLLSARSRSSRDKNALPLIGLALVLLGGHRAFSLAADPGPP